MILGAPGGYIKRKVKSIYNKLVKKESKKTVKVPNILENEINNAEKLKKNSIDELKEIARLIRIKNRDKLKKEGLIISILKSESSNSKLNYEKHFNNTNDDNNNTKDNNNTNDDTYDDKIRDKISDIRMILSRLGNTITSNDRNKIKKELYEIENKKNLTDKEKEKNYDNLVELANKLNKKEKYKYHDRDDLDYDGIRDMGNLFDNVDDNDY